MEFGSVIQRQALSVLLVAHFELPLCQARTSGLKIAGFIRGA
jgi:hypothetical protein